MKTGRGRRRDGEGRRQEKNYDFCLGVTPTDRPPKLDADA